MFVKTKKKKILVTNVKWRPRQTFSSGDAWRRLCPKDTRQEESFRYRSGLNEQIKREVIVKDDIVFHIW